MRKRLGSVLSMVLIGVPLVAGPSVSFAVEATGPGVAIYIIQNAQLKLDQPGLIEAVAGAQLAKLGYKVVPLRGRGDLAQMCPRDVRGVWEADRRQTFQQHFAADILWVAAIDYKPVRTAESSATATVSVYACAFDVVSGDLLWRGQVKDYLLSKATLTEGVGSGLGQIISVLVAEFDRAPKVRAWVPQTRPSPPQPNLPSMFPTSPTVPITSQVPYTGVIIEADHLPGFRPSYRMGIYSPEGQPVYRPGTSRMSWADNEETARQHAGPQPLRIKALRTDGSRIILPQSAARQLETHKSLLERSRVTVVVRPPKH